MQNGLVPHLHVNIKNQEGYLSCGGPSLKSKWSSLSPAQGFSAGERSPHNFWMWKPAGIMAEWDRGQLHCQVLLSEVPLKWQTHLLRAPSLGQPLKSYQGQEVNCLAAGWVLEEQLYPIQRGWQKPLFHPPPGMRMQAEIIAESPSN